jgi:two-component system chemotaxis response regulator CheB
MIRILIIEGSNQAAQAMMDAFRRDPELEICAVAKTGSEGVELAKRKRPDVIVMGAQLSMLDGFEATREIMAEWPTPIVIVADQHDFRQIDVSMRALHAGALTVVNIPKPRDPRDSGQAVKQFVTTVRLMAGVKVVRRWRRSVAPYLPRTGAAALDRGRVQVIAIASSTGGPAALHRILSDLPANFPLPILVVQHIARGFAAGMVDWLNSVCSLKVRLAQNGMPLAPHTVYVANDDFHLGVSARSSIQLSAAAPIEGFRPSATFMFESVAATYGPAAVGVILTGMGRDGAAGLCRLREAGGKAVAQDEETSVVFGMPSMAIKTGAVDEVLPLSRIPGRLMEIVSGQQHARKQ